MPRAGSLRIVWLTLAAAMVPAPACEADCGDVIGIEDGRYDAAPEVDDELAGSRMLVDGDVVTIEYERDGQTVQVILRRTQ